MVIIVREDNVVFHIHRNRWEGGGLSPNILGHQTYITRPRTKTERLRGSVYNTRGQLETFNKTKEPAQCIYINEDLTKRGSLMAFETHTLLGAKKILDCCTHSGHIVVKDSNNTTK